MNIYTFLPSINWVIYIWRIKFRRFWCLGTFKRSYCFYFETQSFESHKSIEMHEKIIVNGWKIRRRWWGIKASYPKSVSFFSVILATCGRTVSYWQHVAEHSYERKLYPILNTWKKKVSSLIIFSCKIFILLSISNSELSFKKLAKRIFWSLWGWTFV